jgi:hypothetical protein
MKTRVSLMRPLYVLCVIVVGCTSAERNSIDHARVAPSAMEVPVIPAEAPTGQEQSLSGSGEEVQERGLKQLKGDFTSRLAATGVVSTGSTSTYPGEFAVRTQRGYYLTAVNGGGRSGDPTVITSATSAGPWEKFKLAIASPPSPYDKTLQTATGNFVTAVNGGGMTANVLHTDATQARDWERFRVIYLGIGVPTVPTYYAIQTVKGNYLTAINAGGKYNDALHTDAAQIKGWEQFRIVKCGDPGSGYEYAVMAADGEFLASDTFDRKTWFGLNSRPTDAEMKLKMIRQVDGTFALQTISGTYLTALGGGGQVEKYDRKYWTPDCGGLFGGPCIGGAAPIFNTNATQVQAWEKFKVIDQGNCTYAIQTSSGFFAGIFKDSSGVMLLTTRRDGAPTPNEKFQLVVFGLASPPVLR